MRSPWPTGGGVGAVAPKERKKEEKNIPSLTRL
jgi:hypothetical protein